MKKILFLAVLLLGLVSCQEDQWTVSETIRVNLPTTHTQDDGTTYISEIDGSLHNQKIIDCRLVEAGPYEMYGFEYTIDNQGILHFTIKSRYPHQNSYVILRYTYIN